MPLKKVRFESKAKANYPIHNIIQVLYCVGVLIEIRSSIRASFLFNLTECIYLKAISRKLKSHFIPHVLQDYPSHEVVLNIRLTLKTHIISLFEQF